MKYLLLFFGLGLCLAVAAAAPAGTWSLIVGHSNDVHGGIDSSEATFMNPEFPPQLGGGASAARLIDQLRAIARQEHKGFLLLDTGDIFQGTLVGTKTKGDAVVRYMNEVGYEAWVLGNHEFDLGRAVPEGLMQQAEFAVLSANVIDTTGGVRRPFARPYLIRDYGVMKVGIVGITTCGTTRASFSENVKNLVFEPEVPTLAAYRDTLRALGCDVVIAACHLGLPFDRWEASDDVDRREQEGWKSPFASNAMELARRVSGIDILFAGDIHVGYQEPWVDPVNHTPCFQGYGRGTNLLAVEFQFDLGTKKLPGWKTFQDDGTLITLMSDRFPRERAIAQGIDTTAARVEQGYNEVIGEAVIPVTRTGEGESLLGNLIADAMRWKLKGDLALTNKGGVRTDLPAGNITPHDVFNVLPFDNTLSAVTVTGRFMKELIEDKVAYGGSGLYASGHARGDRPRQAARRARDDAWKSAASPASPIRDYRLVTTDYLLEGNSGMEKLVSLRDQAAVESGVYMRDADHRVHPRAFAAASQARRPLAGAELRKKFEIRVRSGGRGDGAILTTFATEHRPQHTFEERNMLRTLGMLFVLLSLALTASAQIMINEFYYDKPGAEVPDAKFVEVFGPAGTSLAGYSIVGINGASGADYLTVALTGTIPDDGYYVVGGASAGNVDQVAAIDLQNAGYSSTPECDAVELRQGSTVVDHVCYGACSGDVCLFGCGPAQRAGLRSAVLRSGQVHRARRRSHGHGH